MTNFNFGRASSGVTYPSNEGEARIAQMRKLHLASSQNRKQENAVHVDPVKSYVFIRQQAGLKCTCQDKVSLSNDANSLHDTEHDDPFVMSLQSDADSAYAAVFDASNQANYRDMQENGAYLDEIGEEASLISGNDKGFCSICMNTGWTDGYRLHNGHRLCGFSANYAEKSDGVELANDYRPIAFSGKAGDYVAWKFMVPSSFKRLLHAAAHNNCNLLAAEITVNGQEFSESKLQEFAGKEVEIKVAPVGELWHMTHIDIWMSFADTFIDFPPVQRDSDFQFFEALQTIHFETIGSIPYVDRETIVCEEKYGELWKVSNATSQMTAERQLIKTECDARLVQKNELLYYLNFVTQPFKVFSYQGLERWQGMSGGYLSTSKSRVVR